MQGSEEGGPEQPIGRQLFVDAEPKPLAVGEQWRILVNSAGIHRHALNVQKKLLIFS